MAIFRQRFLGGSVPGGLGIAFSGSVETLAAAVPDGAVRPVPSQGYGPLVHDVAGRLSLPREFAYRVVAEAGVTELESGHRTPRRTCGTANFLRPHGGLVLVTNHEIQLRKPTDYPVPHIEGYVYDPGAPGGCTNIEVSPLGRRLREYVSLAGTASNRDGGRTPWHTWLTCEESDRRAGQHGCAKDHGYVFEVDPCDQDANHDPQPVEALGRFEHEAVAIDPVEGRIYLTEDALGPNGLFYRYTPPASALPLGKGALKALGPRDGVLEVMTATLAGGSHLDDLSRVTEVGARLRVGWARVPERDAQAAPIRRQFPDQEITRSRKLESVWWGDGGAYFVASYARAESPRPHDGQVWFYDPQDQTVTLLLRFAAAADPAAGGDSGAGGPDAIAVSPYGGVLIAEDGDGPQRLVGTTEDGQAFTLARNEINIGTAADPAFSGFTGPNFSPDGRILFANVGDPGIVYAIFGPWRRNAQPRVPGTAA